MVEGEQTVGYIKPDSALVRTATDLLRRHTAQPSGGCAACDEMGPCTSARHAIEVRRAAGLPDAISASDPFVRPPGGGADVLGGGPSFGVGFGGNSSYGGADTQVLATASLGASNANAGAYGTMNRPTPVPLSKD